MNTRKCGLIACLAWLALAASGAAGADDAPYMHAAFENSYYSGKVSMDDFRVYRAPLTPDQIEALYRMGDKRFAGAPPARQGVLAEYMASREFDRIFREAYQRTNGKAASDLGIAPAPGAMLRGNISRDNVGGKTLDDKGGSTFEASAWAPVPNRLNDPKSFGILILE